MTQTSGNANNNVYEKLANRTFVGLYLPVSVRLSQKYFVGSLYYKPWRSKRILMVQATHAPALVEQGWQRLPAMDGFGGDDGDPDYPTYAALPNLIQIGWLLLPEGGLSGEKLG